MAAGDLTTILAVEGWGKIPTGNAATDAQIASLISAASAWITGYCERNFSGVVSVTEIRDGNEKDEMSLGETPIVSITSLQSGMRIIPAQPAFDQPGYFIVPSTSYLGSSRLALKSYRFPRGRRNIQIVYTAGWAAVPLEIAQACIEMVVSAYRRGVNGPDQRSLTVEGQTTAWNLSDISVAAKGILDRYRKVVIP